MFFETDFPSLMLDMGYMVEDAAGTRVLGLLTQEDIVSPYGAGDNILRSTMLTLTSGALVGLDEGDTLITWPQDAPATRSTWNVRRVLVRQDGTPTRVLLAAA